MSEPAKILDPTALDLATVDQIIDELRRRHHSIVLCAMPLPSNSGEQMPLFYASGNYYVNLSMAINASDRLRANNPLGPREGA